MKQKLLAMMFALFAVQATTWAQTSGYCGDPNVNGGKDVIWTLSEGKLVISGTGAMSRGYWKLSDSCEVIINEGVTSIGAEAFQNNYYITSVTIGNSVTRIGDRAFASCSNLTSINISKSVKSLGRLLFEYSQKLTNIVVDEDNPIYDSRDNCNAIIEKATNTLIVGCKATVIPNSVTGIGREAFYSCKFESIIIPTSVTSIGNRAFRDCSRLKNLTIPNSVTSIGDSAFFNCYELESVSIPKSVTSIGYRAFSVCSKIASMVVDKDNPIYDSRDNCNAIIEKATNTLMVGCKTTVIPNSVVRLGEYAFYYCLDANIIIPNSVTEIGRYVFDNCGFTNITIPNSITYIGTGAFKQCYFLKSVIIGNAVTGIGESAFYDCEKLTDVTCLNPIPPKLSWGVFRGIPATSVLKVHVVDSYQASDWAQYFSSIEPLGSESISEVETDRNDAPAIIYDLSGRRVTNPVKGQIYIVNGKAVVM